MVLVFKSILVALVGVALGLAITFKSVERGVGFEAVHVGPWTGWPKSGAREADPYARAARARSGEIPLGITEGLAFIAGQDSAGAPLNSRCDAVLAGATPPARFWTLTATTPDGRFFDSPANRREFTSSEVVRDATGAFSVDIAAAARPGNWLPVAPNQAFQLVFRLYDTPASASAFTLEAAQMPTIARGRCA